MLDDILDKYSGGLFTFVEQLINALNDFLYTFFFYGNYILFVIFVVMGIVLYKSAREIEYRENIHGKIEAQKKRGRAGSVLCILISIGFLSKQLTIFLYNIYILFPEPELMIRWVGDKLVTINTLENTLTLPTYERIIFFLVSLLSLISILSIAFGVYLMLFNKFILRSRLKFLAFLFLGLVFWVVFGFKASLKLLI